MADNIGVVSKPRRAWPQSAFMPCTLHNRAPQVSLCPTECDVSKGVTGKAAQSETHVSTTVHVYTSEHQQRVYLRNSGFMMFNVDSM